MAMVTRCFKPASCFITGELAPAAAPYRLALARSLPLENRTVLLQPLTDKPAEGVTVCLLCHKSGESRAVALAHVEPTERLPAAS